MSSKISKIAHELGLRMEDAKERMLIKVTEHDVKASKVKDPKNCAYARACRERIPGVKAAYFFKSTAWLEYKDRMVRYLLPSSVQKEIVSFDRNQMMEPGDYCLVPPPKAQSLTALRKRNTKREGTRNTGKGAKKRIMHMTTNVRASGW